MKRSKLPEVKGGKRGLWGQALLKSHLSMVSVIDNVLYAKGKVGGKVFLDQSAYLESNAFCRGRGRLYPHRARAHVFLYCDLENKNTGSPGTFEFQISNQ